MVGIQSMSPSLLCYLPHPFPPSTACGEPPGMLLPAQSRVDVQHQIPLLCPAGSQGSWGCAGHSAVQTWEQSLVSAPAARVPLLPVPGGPEIVILGGWGKQGFPAPFSAPKWSLRHQKPPLCCSCSIVNNLWM